MGVEDVPKEKDGEDTVREVRIVTDASLVWTSDVTKARGLSTRLV
jgi:hypothetical protein